MQKKQTRRAPAISSCFIALQVVGSRGGESLGLRSEGGKEKHMAEEILLSSSPPERPTPLCATGGAH